MKETTKIYKIYDLVNKEYITTGNYTKKTNWKVFPSDAIKQNKLDKDRYVVHEFKYQLVQTQILNLDKTEL
jgi:hypothetical protein